MHTTAMARRSAAVPPDPFSVEPYWALAPDRLFEHRRSGEDGLSSSEAARRLRAVGLNRLKSHRRLSRVRTLLAQIRSPLLLLLVFAAAVSAATGEWIDASIVGVVVAATVGIGYAREIDAARAAAALAAASRAHHRHP